MNILFLVPYTPTPVRARPYNLVRSLAQRGHSVTLATLWETERERRALAELAEAGIEVVAVRLSRQRRLFNLLRALPSQEPLQAAYCWQPTLARMVESRLAASPPIDVLHIEHLRGARFGLRLLGPARRRKPRLPVVWDSVDCISLLFEQAAQRSRTRFGRWVTGFELARTRRHEAMLADEFDGVLISAQTDREALQRLAAGRGREVAVRLLPNGVDLEYFTPNLSKRSANTVVLTGKMSYHANVTAALHLVEDVMPLVWAQRPDVRVEVVGQAPAREVRALGERHAPRVAVTGYVADMRPFLWSAAVAAAPIVYGAGSQFKVLEAMACATPVVATARAMGAFQAQAGRDVLVAEDAAGLAAQILRLLEEAGLREAVGRAGWEYVRRRHNWMSIVEILEDGYRELVGRIA